MSGKTSKKIKLWFTLDSPGAIVWTREPEAYDDGAYPPYWHANGKGFEEYICKEACGELFGKAPGINEMWEAELTIKQVWDVECGLKTKPT
jgi:hypothetical protein